MTDNEKRAHEIALALLPKVIEECQYNYYDFDSKGVGHFNNDIVMEYSDLYNNFLNHLNKSE